MSWLLLFAIGIKIIMHYNFMIVIRLQHPYYNSSWVEMHQKQSHWKAVSNLFQWLPWRRQIQTRVDQVCVCRSVCLFVNCLQFYLSVCLPFYLSVCMPADHVLYRFSSRVFVCLYYAAVNDHPCLSIQCLFQIFFDDILFCTDFYCNTIFQPAIKQLLLVVPRLLIICTPVLMTEP